MKGDRKPGNPTIAHAKKLCADLRVRGVIVLAFDEESVGGSSYGETKEECADLRVLLDAIVESIQNGNLKVWSDADA